MKTMGGERWDVRRGGVRGYKRLWCRFAGGRW